MERNDSPSTSTSDEGNGSAKARVVGRHATTRCHSLLERATAAFGVSRLADVLQITTDDIVPFLSGRRSMTLSQQRALAIAVLLLADGHADLRRRAASLLGQVNAAEAYNAGVTQRHLGPGPGGMQWK